MSDPPDYTATLARKRMGAGVLFRDPAGRALLVVDWVPPRPGRTEGVMLVYDGGVLDATHTAGIRLPPDELRAWAWCTAGQAEQRMVELLARRVAAGLRAQADGTTVYLEFGHPVA